MLSSGPSTKTISGTTPSIHWLLQTAESVPTADDWLSQDETRFLQTLKIEKRRNDWLLGRWTAKSLIAHVLAAQVNNRLGFPSISIHKSPDGSPVVDLSSAGEKLPLLTLSISHSHQVGAAALVAAANWPLGIDLEYLEPRHPHFVADYFTMDEQQQLADLPEADQVTAVNAIWSGKEAALKAIRRGLVQDTRVVSCRLGFGAADPDSWSHFEINWDERHLTDRPPTLQGWWQSINGFVLTIATATDNPVRE
ncbi:MAG: 4'-phosphopantetheinyl transferase superfamily protein [Chloroflexota bacterium]